MILVCFSNLQKVNIICWEYCG